MFLFDYLFNFCNAENVNNWYFDSYIKRVKGYDYVN